jgi:apolipoprotein N-acyltransferase
MAVIGLMQSLPAAVGALDGWRRRGIAFLAGSLSVLAMAPFFAAWLLYATFPVCIWLIDGACARAGELDHASHRQRMPFLAVAEIGWWFGFGYFLCGLFWIGEAFLVEANVFAWLLPFAVTLLPAGLALFYAVAMTAAVALVRDWHGAKRVFALALTMSAAEWLRGHVLTGFPWNVLGYALTYPESLMQSAAVFGIYGLTWLTVACFALPGALWREGHAPSIPVPKGRMATIVAVCVLPILCLHSWGARRLALSTEPTSSLPLKIRVVQPSVPQREKWRPEYQERIFLEHLELSRRNSTGQVDDLQNVKLLIWPEAAMPFLPLDTPGALAAIGRLLPVGTTLLTGALRVESATTPDGRTIRRVFNSLLAFGNGGKLTARYDKIHLVPFGEYLPFQSLLEAIGVKQITRVRGGFDGGAHPRPLLRIPGLPSLDPLICYEAIFPAAIVEGQDRPDALVNVTNDGWFGETIGPHQHLHQARVRAVEEGLPLVRAANNGISAVVDAFGRVRDKLDLDVKGAIDSDLPKALAPPPYAIFGDVPFFAFQAFCVLALVRRRRQKRARLPRLGKQSHVL